MKLEGSKVEFRRSWGRRWVNMIKRHCIQVWNSQRVNKNIFFKKENLSQTLSEANLSLDNPSWVHRSLWSWPSTLNIIGQLVHRCRASWIFFHDAEKSTLPHFRKSETCCLLGIHTSERFHSYLFTFLNGERVSRTVLDCLLPFRHHVWFMLEVEPRGLCRLS